MLGLYKREREESSPLTVYRSGRRGLLRHRRSLLLQGRLGEQIPSPQHNVTPREVELVLEEHPSPDGIVMGVHITLGEDVAAPLYSLRVRKSTRTPSVHGSRTTCLIQGPAARGPLRDQTTSRGSIRKGRTGVLSTPCSFIGSPRAANLSRRNDAAGHRRDARKRTAAKRDWPPPDWPKASTATTMPDIVYPSIHSQFVVIIVEQDIWRSTP